MSGKFFEPLNVASRFSCRRGRRGNFQPLDENSAFYQLLNGTS